MAWGMDCQQRMQRCAIGLELQKRTVRQRLVWYEMAVCAGCRRGCKTPNRWRVAAALAAQGLQGRRSWRMVGMRMRADDGLYVATAPIGMARRVP